MTPSTHRVGNDERERWRYRDIAEGEERDCGGRGYITFLLTDTFYR